MAMPGRVMPSPHDGDGTPVGVLRKPTHRTTSLMAGKEI